MQNLWISDANKNYYYIDNQKMNLSINYQPNAAVIILCINKNIFGH